MTGETTHLQRTANPALREQLDKLFDLRDGWLDGAGKAPPVEDLEWLANQLVEAFPAPLPRPFVCPTPAGGVFLEWTLGDWIVSAEFPLPERRCELQAANTKSHQSVDEDLLLADRSDFAGVSRFLRRFV